jgi:hypothetical protein
MTKEELYLIAKLTNQSKHVILEINSTTTLKLASSSGNNREEVVEPI